MTPDYSMEPPHCGTRRSLPGYGVHFLPQSSGAVLRARLNSNIKSTMKFLAVLAAILLSSMASADTPFRTGKIMLLQPEGILEARVPSVPAFSEYIIAVHSAAERALADDQPHSASGYLVLAVRPGRKSMIWLDFKPGLPESSAAKLRAAILAVPAFEVRGGNVVFALSVSLWDAPASQAFPRPEEWSKAMEGHDEPIEIGELVDKVWPVEAGN